MGKKTIVVHSGGMDSSLCLALAAREFGKNNVLSLSFLYHQRHLPEVFQAAKICQDWEIDHVELKIDCLQEITTNALLNVSFPILQEPNHAPNTLVVGRNGLMAHLAGIHAQHIGASSIYLGVMELEGANSGYRDCSRYYMDLQQEILRIDLNDPSFEIRTPLIQMTKKETMELAEKLGILDYLWKETISCYEGLPVKGCQQCPACKLRNGGLAEFLKENPEKDPNFINYLC